MSWEYVGSTELLIIMCFKSYFNLFKFVFGTDHYVLQENGHKFPKDGQRQWKSHGNTLPSMKFVILLP